VVPTEMLTASVENDAGGSIVLHFAGEIDIAAREPVAAAIRVVLDCRPTQVTVDLEHVRFCDSHGMRNLIDVATACANARVPCRLVGAQPNVRHAFELLALDGMLS